MIFKYKSVFSATCFSISEINLDIYISGIVRKSILFPAEGGFFFLHSPLLATKCRQSFPGQPSLNWGGGGVM